jgi:tRNA C32,U32 (ribose-2'-O)-methylase TrmJ
MLERLQAAADKQANRMLMRVIRRLTARAAPSGVEIKALSDGVELSGKRLKRRMIDDPNLRNFGR